MDLPTPQDPVIIVIAGASGDLTQRKLIPALFDLFHDRWLPGNFAIVGVDRRELNIDAFRDHLLQGVHQFSRNGNAGENDWTSFARNIEFVAADFDNPAGLSNVAEKLAATERAWGKKPNQVFYLAVPPNLVGTIAQRMETQKLCSDRERVRVVFEKPFGRDLASAHELNAALMEVFSEQQIYRIDHYLGKETVQNILAFRFANALLEPIWDRRYIDHVQITVAESIGVEHRGAYYERAGALRDMIQNHLLQLLCLIAMEPPVSFDANEIRNKKVDVLHAIRPITRERIHQSAVRGQYGPGWMRGENVTGYRSESDVAPDSSSETYAALKLFVDNWRWQDVPFYLRTGKRLATSASEVTIQLRPVPHQAFPSEAMGEWLPNRIIIHIHPEEGISTHLQAKHPGPAMRLRPVVMRFLYREAFGNTSPAAYETLLIDVIRGDPTLFMRADQIEAAWSVVTPVLNAWEEITPIDFPNYQAGTWGPEAAEVLIAQDGRSWLQPAIPHGDMKEGPIR